MLFLKMAEEQRQLGKRAIISKDLGWRSLQPLNGYEFDTQYRRILPNWERSRARWM